MSQVKKLALKQNKFVASAKFVHGPLLLSFQYSYLVHSVLIQITTNSIKNQP